MWLVFVSVIVFLFGLAFGSFMNAFEYRIKHGKNFVRDRSECPHCYNVLSAKDLVPLLSWIWLRGKCRYCSKPISKQYPIVELATGFGFIIYFLSLVVTRGTSHCVPCPDADVAETLFGTLCIIDIVNVMTPYFLVSLAFGLLAVWGLIFFALYDIKHGLILDKVLFPIIVITLAWYVLPFIPGLNLPETDFFVRIISGLGAGAFFFLIILITKGKGMGGGDMKLVLWLGLLTGFPGIVYSLYLAFIVGGFYGAILLLLKKKEMKQSIPFGPFLAIATMIVFIFQDVVHEVFQGLFFPGLS